MLPFTRDSFVAIFVDYNAGVWPAQIVAAGIGIGVVVAVLRPSRSGDRWIAFGLAALWAWTGVAYHAAYFARINPIAIGFGAAFVAQAALLAIDGGWRGRLHFEAATRSATWSGWSLVAYAALLYPLVGLLAGQRSDELPAFGITPCPLTLFTFGVLLLARPPLRVRWFVIPLLWSAIGGSAAFLLQMPEDLPLPLAGVLAGALLWRQHHARPRGLLDPLSASSRASPGFSAMPPAEPRTRGGTRG